MRLLGTKLAANSSHRGFGDQLYNLSGQLPSLDLNFFGNKSLTDSTTGRNLIDFTRASSGTFVGSDGLIKTAVTNLQTFSEEFGNAAYGVSAGSVSGTNVGIAPNGASTADEVTTTGGGVFRSLTAATTAIYTASVYAKYVSGGTSFSFGCDSNPSNARTVFNLQTGVIVSNGASVTSSSITPMGNDWYRCSVTFVSTSTSIILVYYNATSGSRYLLWGAQLEQSPTVGEYIPTTSVINSAPRFDHNPTTGESLGLLVEEQRTNSVTNNTMVGAVAGTPGTNPTGWLYASAQSNGLTISIAGAGVENGINYIDYRFNGTTVATPNACAIGVANGTAATGQTWTASVYWKLVGGTSSGVASWQLGIIESTSVGAFVSGAFYSQTAPTSAALITQRPSATRTLSGGATVGLASYVLHIPVVGNTAVDFTIRYGLPQLEQGAFATSVIPTSGTAATRSADVASITGSNFSSWYRQDEGTVLVDAARSPAVTGRYPNVGNFSDGTGSNRIQIYGLDYGDRYTHEIVSAGSPQVAFNQSQLFTPNTFNKLAVAYKTNDTAFVAGASLVLADSLVTLPAVNQLSVSGVDSRTIRRLTYWPTRLSNNTLQQITQP